MEQFDFGAHSASDRVIFPLREAAAYEALWTEKGINFKKLAAKFKQANEIYPSNLVSDDIINEYEKILQDIWKKNKLSNIDIHINGIGDYPNRLRDAESPLELFYSQGNVSLLKNRAVSVIGSRKASDNGKRRARKLVKLLVQDGFTIISGLAEGIDTEAHKTAIACGGSTIGVIGTPLSHYYPKENKELQDLIRNNYLLISQIPFQQYTKQTYKVNSLFFPERNITMSALSEATIIIEAADRSGTLRQANAAIQQGRKLFVLESCFNDFGISWPREYEEKGAIRVREYEDIRRYLNGPNTKFERKYQPIQTT